MLPGMNAYSSLAGSTMADSWPMTRVMAGASAVPVGHAIDLAFLFPGDDAPHDALIAETRRHLAGCVTAIELALRVSLDHAGDVARALDSVPDGASWSLLYRQPTLLSPALVGHMRLRAAVTLMLRHGEQADGDRRIETGVDPVASDPALQQMASALALAEGRWSARGGEGQPMRPDLPAELFSDLTWSVAACLAVEARSHAPEGAGRMIVAFERSGWALLADHDESVSPLPTAERLVRQLGDRADDPALIGVALEGRRFLLFAALAARRVRMPIVQVIDMLLCGPVDQLAVLCRALGGGDADYRQLLLAMRPVRPVLTDRRVVAEADRYGALTGQDADMAMAALRTPGAFRAKLDHLSRVLVT